MATPRTLDELERETRTKKNSDRIVCDPVPQETMDYLKDEGFEQKKQQRSITALLAIVYHIQTAGPSKKYELRF